MTRTLSGFRSFRDIAEQADPVRPAPAERDISMSSAGGRHAVSTDTPPAAANATVSNQQVRTRFVMVHTEAGERPGLILEWVKAIGAWSARVAYVVDDNATMIVEWVPATELTPATAG